MKRILSSILFTFVSFSMFCQNPTLVSDINIGNGDAAPDWGTSYKQVNDYIYFHSETNAGQGNLFVIKNGGLHFLKNVCKNCLSTSLKFENINDKVFFAGYDGSNFGLWSSQGSTETTSEFFRTGADLTDRISHIVKSANGNIYFITENALFVTDGSVLGTKKIGGTYKFAKGLENVDATNIRHYNSGISFIENNGAKAILYAVDGEVVSKLGEVGGLYSTTKVNGLCNVPNGLVFLVDHTSDANVKGMYYYDAMAGTITRSTLINPSGIGRIIELNGSVVSFSSSNGIELLHDYPLQKTFLNSHKPIFTQTEEINQNSIGNAMFVSLPDFFDDLLFRIDANTKKATKIADIERYPSDFIKYNDNIFFADGTSNGNKPRLYHLKPDVTTITPYKTYTESSSINSFMPIGLNGDRLYYFSNLDNSIGRELYSIKVDASTPIETINEPSASISVAINNSLVSIISDKFMPSIKINVLSLDGKLIQTATQSSDDTLLLTVNNQVVIIVIQNLDTSALSSHKVYVK